MVATEIKKKFLKNSKCGNNDDTENDVIVFKNILLPNLSKIVQAGYEVKRCFHTFAPLHINKTKKKPLLECFIHF